MQQRGEPRANYYRAKSAECLVLAARIKDPGAAALFHALAMDYHQLADAGNSFRAGGENIVTKNPRDWRA